MFKKELYKDIYTFFKIHSKTLLHSNLKFCFCIQLLMKYNILSILAHKCKGEQR